MLEEALQGPADLYKETEKSNRGRNATFELVVAGLYARAGLPVEFRENPDILSKYSGRPLVIQCKRPFKPTSIPNNLSDAGRQLRTDLKADPAALAIIAVSFSRLFNQGHQIAAFTSEEEMDAIMRSTLRKAVSQFDGGLQEIKRYGVTGVFVHTATPAFISASRQMTYRQIGTLTPVAADKAQIALLEELAKLVKLR